MAEQSNPGVKVLVTGAVLGLAAAGLGIYSYMDSATAPETNINASKNSASLTAEADMVKESLKRDRTVADAAPEGATVNGQPRLAPLFFSTELWQITLDEEKKNTVVDIYDPAAPSIHGDIPNTWFIANNIADALGRSDGRVLDSDNDGFTNEEEFVAKTCPSAANSYPDLVQPSNENVKLEVTKVSVTRATLEVENMFGMADKMPEKVTIRVYGANDALVKTIKEKKPGDSFGVKKTEKERFTIVRFDKAEFAGFAGVAMENVVVVRDNMELDPAKREFVIRAGTIKKGMKPDENQANQKGRRISDTRVEMRVTAGSQKDKEFSVRLLETFVIPGGKADGSELRATLKDINDKDGSVNIQLDGAQSPNQVRKASAKK